MAKKLTFTASEIAKAVALVGKALTGTGGFKERHWKGLTAAQQAAVAEKQLRRHATRKAGAVDWESFLAALMKYLPQLIALIMSFFPK